MKTITKALAALSLSAMMGITSFGPANAMPLPSVAQPTQATDIQSVQWDRRDWRERRDRREWREERRDRREWRERRAGYYGGHRGYRDYRRGYRRHSDGFWYPLAAFGAGAIIGGAVTSQPRVSGGGSHQQWCANRYRSYRAYDNTYVPRAGVRAQCNSPYN